MSYAADKHWCVWTCATREIILSPSHFPHSHTLPLSCGCSAPEGASHRPVYPRTGSRTAKRACRFRDCDRVSHRSGRPSLLCRTHQAEDVGTLEPVGCVIVSARRYVFWISRLPAQENPPEKHNTHRIDPEVMTRPGESTLRWCRDTRDPICLHPGAGLHWVPGFGPAPGGPDSPGALGT